MLFQRALCLTAVAIFLASCSGYDSSQDLEINAQNNGISIVSGYNLTTVTSQATPGQTISANWRAPQGHAKRDWVGLYRVGDPNSNTISRVTVNSTARTGTVQLTLPANASGNMELRYFTYNNSVLAAKTSTIVVVGASDSGVDTGTVDTGTVDTGTVDTGTVDTGDSGIVWGNSEPYGIPDSGYPNWQERSILVLTNAVRIAPVDYKDRFMTPALGAKLTGVTVLSNTYPPVGVLKYNKALNEASRFHSNDLATTAGCAFSHNSCDGTAPFTRVRRFFTLPVSLAENIAAGNSSPISTMNQWLCDQEGNLCCNDGAVCDGHRRNIMNGSYGLLGVGYAEGGTYRYYWTQDFAGKIEALPPLVDGSHVLNGGKIQFYANYYAPQDVRSISVYINGVEQSMVKILGTSAKGTHMYEVNPSSSCRSYYFVAVDHAGTYWRYPTSGAFRTTGDNCTEVYVNP